jgi:hypothetical protein
MLSKPNVFPDQMKKPLQGVETGGEHNADLTSYVTHRPVEVGLKEVHLTEKYRHVAANREDVPLEKEYKLPIFAGLSVCLTGFNDCKSRVIVSLSLGLQNIVAFRAHLRESIIAHGGDYRGELTKNVTTHLIANAPEGEKYQHAEQWDIRVVSLCWFKDCLDRGMVLDENLYHPTMSCSLKRAARGEEAKAKVLLGKRPRGENPPPKALRKRWRTAGNVRLVQRPPATDQHAITTNAANTLKRSHDQMSKTIAEQGRSLRLAEDAVCAGDTNYRAKISAVGTQYARALEQVKIANERQTEATRENKELQIHLTEARNQLSRTEARLAKVVQEKEKILDTFQCIAYMVKMLEHVGGREG